MDQAPIDILYVEDSPADAEMTLRAFRKQRLANKLIWVKDGEEALHYLFREGAFANRPAGNPNLVLLDLKMPKVNGLEVLQRIKGSPDLKSIPVVMLTSSAEDTDIAKAYELGVNSYIVKPVGFDNFSEIVLGLGMYWMVSNRAPA
jgi:CheY-like chemotaxis protein